MALSLTANAFAAVARASNATNATDFMPPGVETAGTALLALGSSLSIIGEYVCPSFAHTPAQMTCPD